MATIDPADLGVFLAIARQGSFRRAAAELGVTPSALSHSMRLLEERLGVRLFNRTTRSVALTEAGGRLFGRVNPAFRDIHDAIDELNLFRDRPFGTLRLNAPRLCARLVLMPLLTRFMAAYPDIRVELAVSDALVDIVADGFDAGIRFGENIAADMLTVPIGPRHAFAVVGSPGYFARHGTPQDPRELRDKPCIRFRFPGGGLYAWEFERGGEEVAVEVDGPLTLSEQDLMLEAALDGAGMAYLFEAQVRPHLASGTLVRVLEDWCPHYPGFYLYYPSRRQMPATLRSFIDYSRGAGSSRQD
ncbi:LysR family transcriptional regulator [Ancylobacter defluvii]|uniref:LysR family transcriptional regulator n=1 Tax=Ancylobacter defluvii TaxID=1282440 RepID=A0A9W6JWP8_9HYPH|nr:LysR family transcriptional regulator [Ancylobacter defluvii]MBS7588956.1 LysR family transcriptional regulator [Ancylobacter defluvii]GLK84557.1 LysR family transcriptional regulator [Ancylobacter defluvii]